MSSRDVQRVARGQQAPRPARELGTVSDAPPAPETDVLKIGTTPNDFRFPCTNQTRHCCARYLEYHQCRKAKGEESPECEKFQRYDRSLCPIEWVVAWNEQREVGTFPGPLRDGHKRNSRAPKGMSRQCV
ncbi:Cytochrome c oxidase subunit [Musa troglodytarum]|uniref:Cytochrome c oxidase subunit n=1 Tax=Musa troglodytarum TaxID=320322 RepID=A0A9E7G5N2_9LILI|nr:Cytochrome c oxidase subunit [Musa troglodytarum]